MLRATVPALEGAKDEVNIMHRTQSVDFGVVLSGTITLVLDDGSETFMKQGEVCVQRGTNHVRLPSSPLPTAHQHYDNREKCKAKNRTVESSTKQMMLIHPCG
jgi:hypothetical protein